MSKSEHDPEELLRLARTDDRPAGWVTSAARGLEARVLQRLAQPETWTEALFSLTSWRPLAAAVLTVVIISLWTGRGVAEVFNDDWLTSQTADESSETLSDADVADLEL